MSNKHTEKYGRYSELHESILSGSNFILNHYTSKIDATYKLYQCNKRCDNWWQVNQTIPTSPLAVVLHPPDTRLIDPYLLVSDENKLQHMSGLLLGSWDTIKLPMFNPKETTDNILSDMLSASFFSLIDDDIATADGYFQTLLMFLSLQDITIKEDSKLMTDANSREDRITSNKMWRVK